MFRFGIDIGQAVAGSTDGDSKSMKLLEYWCTCANVYYE